MDALDIVVIVIGGVTVSLLLSLLVLVRTVYVVVRRDSINPTGPGEGTG